MIFVQHRFVWARLREERIVVGLSTSLLVIIKFLLIRSGLYFNPKTEEIWGVTVGGRRVQAEMNISKHF